MTEIKETWLVDDPWSEPIPGLFHTDSVIPMPLPRPRSVAFDLRFQYGKD